MAREIVDSHSHLFPPEWAPSGRMPPDMVDGLAGLALATSDHGGYLDSIPEEFWAWVHRRDVVVFLHPGGTVLGQEHMGGYRLAEVCGRPLDTTLTLARFILMGFMERFD